MVFSKILYFYDQKKQKKQEFMKSGQFTFSMIKPTAFHNKHAGEIITMIYERGFQIVAMKMTRLSYAEAQMFYKVHEERPFYTDLCKFMSSGPIIALILVKENAVEDYRKIIGSTDPSQAEEGTIRHVFGLNIQQNAVHGSDSDENALYEARFFFSELEIYRNA
jgi:nucleoside-diphosphate kinase